MLLGKIPSQRVLPGSIHLAVVFPEMMQGSREVFLLSRRDHLSNKEIAQRLGISVKAVEKHMGKSLRVMRHEFKDYGLVVILPVIFYQ